MKRLFTPENLIEAFITIVVLVVSSVVAYGQEPAPAPAPSPPVPRVLVPAVEPTPALSIEGPTEGIVNDFNDFTAMGHPEKCTFTWHVLPRDHKAKIRLSDKQNSLTLVGPPGKYSLLLVVSDGTAAQSDWHEFTIPGDIPTPPGPPRPPVVVKTLRDLAGPDATKVEKLHADMLEAIGKGLFDTVERFKEVYAAAVKDRGLENNLAVLECSKRLGLATLDEIKAALVKINDELKTAPTPISGKRHVVILHESADDTAEQARIWNQLRAGQASEYMISKGHKLDILDDDVVDGSGQLPPLVAKLNALNVATPALFILDESKAVLHSQALPSSTSQIMEVLKAHGG